MLVLLMDKTLRCLMKEEKDIIFAGPTSLLFSSILGSPPHLRMHI